MRRSGLIDAAGGLLRDAALDIRVSLAAVAPRSAIRGYARRSRPLSRPPGSVVGVDALPPVVRAGIPGWRLLYTARMVRAGVIQMVSTADVQANLAAASDLGWTPRPDLLDRARPE